jgi:hypothetical protein
MVYEAHCLNIVHYSWFSETKVSMLYVYQQMYLFIILESTKIYIKIHIKMLLHISVYDHHQEAYNWT